MAVSLLFVVNAGAWSNVVPRLSGIKVDLGLSNTALGLALACVSVGALAAGPAAGRLLLRWGSAGVATAAGLCFAALLPVIALAPVWAALAGALLAFGVLDSLMDVAMNTQALRVQRAYGRSIVNGVHGLWSLGAVLGAAAGSLAASAEVAIELHLALAGLVLGALTLLARPALLPGADDADREDAGGAATAADEDLTVAAGATGGADGGADGAAPSPSASGRTRVVSRDAARRLVALGSLLVLAGAIEDSPASWGAVLMREELGTSAGAAGLLFLAFMSAMTVSRLTADRVADRWGPERMLRLAGIAIAAGTAIGLLVGHPVSAVAGFAVAGWGAGPIFPTVFHAAGNLPGVPSGHGVAAVAWASRLGFLVVPPLVGVLGDALTVQAALAVVPVAGAVLALLAGAVRHDRRSGPEVDELAARPGTPVAGIG